LFATPTQAACHKFSIWHYRTPQRCRAIAYVPQKHEARFVRPPSVPPERIDIPLPDLSVIDWGQEGDEHLRGLALLRALRQ
jgi:hypothetical protein